MMDNNDQRLSMNATSVPMNDINGESVLMSNIELLPNMSNIMDDQIMQLLGNQNYIMTDGSHLADTHRAVNSIDSVNSGHNSMQSVDRNSMDSCNYVSNQYEHQYHDSSDPHRYKYRSSGMSTVAETVTHVSESDNSITGQNNFGSVGPSVQNIQQNYPMNPMNNWSHNQNHNMSGHQIRGPKDMLMSGPLQHKTAPHSSTYIPRQRISNFVPNVPAMNPSTTSTPVSQTLNNLVILNNNNINKNSPQVLNEGLVQCHRLETPTAQKRTLIIFKVIDQIVDSSGKVLKETVIKNEEIVKNMGKVDWNESTSSPLSSITNVSRFASNTNSGVLADVSSSSASLETRHNKNNESLSKSHSSNKSEEFFNKMVTPIPIPPVVNNPITNNTIYPKNDIKFVPNLEIRTTFSNDINTEAVGQQKVAEPVVEPKLISEKDEEERRETATALLCLTQRSLNIDCNLNEQKFSKDFSRKPGNRVMAKWRDKNFYPAVIAKHLPQNNKWSVIFEDRATRNLFDNELIQLTNLVEGQDVMVTISDGFCVKATIKTMVNDSDGLFFEVDHLKDDKLVTKRYPLKDIFLNVEQSSGIAFKSVKPTLNGAVFADVDLDNIVSGKRARITTKAEAVVEKPVQTFKNGRRRPAETVSVDVDCVEEEAIYEVKPKKKANIVRTNKKKTESHNALFNNEHSLSISPRTTKVHTSIPPQELIKLLGPLPEVGSIIFERISFILTCGDRNRSDDLCNEQSNPERSTPFDKLYLTKQIEMGGGKVFESMEDMKNSEYNMDMVLIADTYHRSIKYIQCLAAGISIASHLWVIDCCRQNQLLKRDNYILPAGFSIITNSLPSDKNTFKKSSTLFKGTKFGFGSKTPEQLHSLWAPVLSAAQAIIVDNSSISITTLSRKLVDIIIGDTTCSAEFVKKAKQLKIAVISSEYIVQCLINGRKLSYDASPLFSYTYKNNL